MAKKEKFGDIVENHELVKRTLMVAAYPALIKQVEKDGEKCFEGFLPGFEFAQVSEIYTEDEIVEVLQDMLDDEVEELVVFGKSLPYVEEDDELNAKYPEHKIVYLDINVYASKEELDFYDSCTHDCSTCSNHCYDDEGCYCNCDDACDCEDDCDCEDCCDDDCDCHAHTDCCEEHCDCHHEHKEEKTPKKEQAKPSQQKTKTTGKTTKKAPAKSNKKTTNK
ncbi:MAG: hypothetical protein IJD48_02450 [Clostridia bacterium]|nr:hypothetical protein [Clostridia bacterium]